MKMQFLLALASGMMANAALVYFYSDNDCKNLVEYKNINNGTCMGVGKFRSFVITSADAAGHDLSAYWSTSCDGGKLAFEKGEHVWTCIETAGLDAYGILMS